MNSEYFIIEIYVRGQLKTIIEKDTMREVSQFLVRVEPYEVTSHNDCRVDIHKAYVSSKQRVGLIQFMCRDTDMVTRLALKHYIKGVK